jgi:hypothetical protein
MALTEPDLDPGRGSILVRQGKGGSVMTQRVLADTARASH